MAELTSSEAEDDSWSSDTETEDSRWLSNFDTSTDTSRDSEMSVDNCWTSSSFSSSSAEISTETEESDSSESSDDSESDGESEDSVMEDEETADWESLVIEGNSLQPLYEGSDISIFDSHFLLFEFAIRHSLTKKAFSELIALVATHLPKVAKLPASVYKLKQFFLNIFPDTASVTHKYCSKCHHLLGEDATVCENRCKAKVNQFIEIPVGPQLKIKLEDPKIWTLLKQCFNRPNQPSELIHDIYDGLEYKKHSSFRSHPANVSFICNTDGVALFRSSKRSIWPIWMAINELPPNQRFTKRNLLLAGLWYSDEKPTMATYLQPMLKSMNVLFTEGIEVMSPDGSVTAHAMLLACSVDLPARAIVLNMKQYNGKYACCYCEDPGVPRESSHLHRNWPYNREVVARSHSSLKKNAADAIHSNDSIMGVKGASVLCLHPPFNLVKGMVVDILHTWFLGVVLRLLGFWFDKAHHQQRYSIRNKMALCDQRLLSIQVPDVVTRPPRSLTEYSHWKGSELRSWVLFYALPVLHGILPLRFFAHFCYLVAALHLLLSDAISMADLKNSYELLKKFNSKHEQLYGKNSATMNLHILRHTVACVYNWGPLWAYSCFPFETMNREIKSLFHGSKDMNKELAFSYVMMQTLPVLRCVKMPRNCRVQLMLDKLTGNKRMKKYPIHGNTNFWILGQSTSFILPQDMLRHNSNQIPQPVHKFYRLMIGHTILYSKEYRRVKRRNSYTISCTTPQEQLVQIQYFFHAQGSVFAVVKKLVPTHRSRQSHFSLPHNALDVVAQQIIPVVLHDNLTILLINSSVQKCVFIDISGALYVVKFPNSLFDD